MHLNSSIFEASMDEKALYRTAMACTIIGLIAVIAAAKLIEVKQVNISELPDMEGEYVKVEGKVSSISVKKAVTIIEINDSTGSLAIAVFADDSGLVKKQAIPEGLEKGDLIEAEGNVQEYNGQMELLAESISQQ